MEVRTYAYREEIELEWLLCVSDHIVEMTKYFQMEPNLRYRLHIAYCGIGYVRLMACSF